MTDIEAEANELNAADQHLREAMRAYAAAGWTDADFSERVQELIAEEWPA